MCSFIDFSHASLGRYPQCNKCNYRGSCFDESKSVLEDPCICNEYYLTRKRRRLKYGDRDCSVLRKCWEDMDCHAGTCNDFGLCECDNGWEGNQCNYKERCPPNQCSGRGKCMNTHELLKSVVRDVRGYYINYDKVYSRVERPCECADGFVGFHCEFALSSECNNHGYIMNDQCTCVDGFSGDHCELCEKCNFVGTCGNLGKRDNENGVCLCIDGYSGSSCECLYNQCGVGGTCQSDGSCKCDPGYIGSDCSGHGTCDNSGCTCDYGFKGTSCNICEDCESYDGEHLIKKGTYLKKEDFVVRLEEKPSVHFYREYNKAPWRAVKIPEANTVEKCYDACVSLGNHASTRKSTTYGRVVTKWADRLDWDESILLDMVYSDMAVFQYGFGMRTDRYKNAELLDMRDVTDYYLGNSSRAYYFENLLTNYPKEGNKKTGVRLYTSNIPLWYRTYEETYDNSYVQNTDKDVGVPSGSICDQYQFCYWDSNKDVCTRFCVEPGTDKYRDEQKIPPPPLYDYTMRNFWNKYSIDDVTHFELLGDDDCLCYTGKETDVGSQKILNFDAKISDWDLLWSQSDSVEWGTSGLGIIQTSTYEKVLGKKSYFVHKNASYVVPCGEGEYSVDTHCCSLGRGPSKPGALDCDKNTACDPNMCGTDYNGDQIQCFNSDTGKGINLTIPENQYVCKCAERLTGDACDKPCCKRGESVDGVLPAAEVHGDCKQVLGGCTCDYGYYGHECQCTDSMCGYGFCNRTLEEEESVTPGNMCICHPGYELDGDGKCTINIDDCASKPCQNDAECVDLADAYHCKCPLGYVGDNCENATGWDESSTSCGVNQYLVSGRCIDCPFGTYSLEGSTTCRVELTDDNIHNAVEEAMSDTTFYGDISTFDTSKVTNMDNLFLNKAVPDISGWDISSVTSMRNMFAGSTGVFDRTNWNITSKDATNIYAGSDLELQFVERTSGSCLDNQESEVRPVMSSLECLYAQYDATTAFSSTVWVRNLLASDSRSGCRYPVAANSHEFTFRPLNINDLEECTSEVPCLCAKIRPGEYVKADACEGVYEPITSVEECTIAVRHLGEIYGVMDLTDGLCVHNQPVCKMKSYSPCDGTTDCIHNGLLCKSGVIIDDTCKVDNEALRDMVQLWNLYPDASLWLYGPLKDWDVHYVTDTTDLFKNMQKDPDITLWDMSNVVHTDGMFAGSLFSHPIDNKDFSSLQTATGMLPQDYGHRACGKHFVRAGKGNSSEGFEHHGKCLRSDVPYGATKTIIHQAVDDWFDGNKSAVIAKYGVMSEWDVSEVETMQGLFKNRTSIPSLLKWDVSKVTKMMSMFENSDFNEDIRHWDVRKVTDFSSMFKNNKDFAIDLTFWEAHASTHKDMFFDNPYYDGITFLIDKTLPEVLTDASFGDALTGWFGSDRADVKETYGNISDWLTYQVTDMSEAFKDKQFNGDISRWVVSSVTDMSSMFENSAFNSDISGWEVVNVKNMNSMFKDSPFNQMIDRWNVFNVADMAHMFENTPFSRPIGDWDLFGTEPNEIQAANDLDNDWCLVSTGLTVNVDEYNRASLAARRKCFDVCTDLYPVSLPDIEGRNRNRGGGRVGKHYTPYRGGFGMVTNELYNHTCMCADETVICESSPFDYVYDYRDMDTTDMFKGNTKFVQPLCGLGWRYRDITSLGLSQQQVSLTCDICTFGQHMMECGLCLGEFRFDRCMDSPLGFTINELEELGLTVEEDGETKVNPFACNCEYEDGMKGCLVVNGRRQVRMKEWYFDGETDFTDYITDRTQYFCEVNFLDERPVANAEGFNSVTCTEDTLLDRFECGLVGGNWDGSCDKCLEPCDPPELGTKFISVNRTCTECPEGKTVFQNECVQCPDGKFTSEDHAYCGKCPQGTYGENGECHTCRGGTASTYEGAIQCQMCGNNTYSVGTACLKCAVNEKSEAGSNFCEEARYCWHGDTSVGDEVGNYCTDSCHSNFKHTGTTCVSSCMYGDVVKVANEYRCQCHDKWQGTECDECPDEFDFRYTSHEMCVERICSDTLVTDCYCSTKIVKDDEFCYDKKIKQKCSEGGSECMCDMGDGYEWAPDDTTCMGGKIVKDCDLFDDTSVPLEPCRNAGYTCKYGLRDNVCTDAFQCEARHFEPGADCCYGGYCSHEPCKTTQYNKGGVYVASDECCLERELCSDAGYSCGLRTGYKLKEKPGYVSIRAPTVFQNRGEFDGVCCEEVPYKLHPYSKCEIYFAERELTTDECDEYVDIYDQNQGYSAPVIFEGQCIMERTLGGIKSTTVVCIQEV